MLLGIFGLEKGRGFLENPFIALFYFAYLLLGELELFND